MDMGIDMYLFNQLQIIDIVSRETEKNIDIIGKGGSEMNKLKEFLSQKFEKQIKIDLKECDLLMWSKYPE